MERNVRFETVVARLRRRLAQDAVRLKKTAGGAANRWYRDLGEWHTVDHRNHSSGWVDPVALARELGVLLPCERVVEAQEATATA